MKYIEKLFTEDSEQKEFLKKISSLCGLKKDIITQVWQYTFFQVYLDLLENKDKPYNEILLPYIGRLLIRPRENKDMDIMFAMNDNFSKVYKNIKNGDETGLIQFFQENFINKVIDNIQNE
jgi:hypothetical protein